MKAFTGKMFIGAIAMLLIFSMPVTQAYSFGGSCGNSGGGSYGCRDEIKWSRGADHMSRMFKGLDLTEEQVLAVKEEFKGRKEKNKEVRVFLRGKKTVLQQEMMKENASREKADIIASEIARAKADMMKQRVERVFALKAILTPGQYGRLMERMDKAGRHHGKKRSKRGKDCEL